MAWRGLLALFNGLRLCTMAVMSFTHDHALQLGAKPAEDATALYVTVSPAAWAEHAPSEHTWAVAERHLQRHIKAGAGQWWHRSASGLCVAFSEWQAALDCAWRMPLLAGLRPSGRWRLSLDVVGAAGAMDALQVARLHGLALLAQDSVPVMGHRLRDQLHDPVEAQVEDLGLCHLKHMEPALRVYRMHRPPLTAAPMAMPEAAPPTLPRLVLLAPVAIADSPAHRSFGTLLVDRVSHQLGRSAHVCLVHTLSSQALVRRAQAPAPTDAQAHEDARRWLAADYVLKGNYRVLGAHSLGTLQLQLSLHELRGDSVVWAQEFRAEVGDVLAADSELVQAVSTGVHHAVLHAHMDWARQQPVRSLDDYALLLTGVGLMHRSAPDDFDVSRQALLALLERAPEMGQAHAWLAKWHVLRVTRALSTQPDQEAEQAQAHAQRAMVASDAQGLARAMQGFVRLHLLRDLPGALSELQICTQLHPNEPLAWLFLGVAESFADQGQHAIQASQRALALSPLDPLLYYFESLAASSAIVSGDAAQARRWCEQSLRRNLMHLHTHRAYITALCMQGEVDAARRAAQQMLRLAPGYTVAQFARGASSASTRLGQRICAALTQAGVPMDG